MTTGGPFGAGALAEAHKYCASLAREHVRDQWLGSLYAAPSARDALLALASFDYEIGQARFRARDPNLAAIRLAWWREVARGERDDEAAGNPVALALRSAIDAFALPRDRLEAMIDARLAGDRAAGRFQPHGLRGLCRGEPRRAAAPGVADRSRGPRPRHQKRACARRGSRSR